MFTTKVEAVIKAPIEKVYSYVRNLETMVEYNSSLKHAKWTDSEKNSCAITLSLSIVNINSDYRIISEEKGKSFLASCDSTTLKFDDYYEFEDRGENTFLRITDNIELKGLLRLSEGILSGIFRKEMQENMDRLVRNLEK
ncbi:MAG TPA: SRPBCC family protein [Leptospiraceae bacterium]|nr:SRPBCC family protein [Leptospiraceae bacterium]HMW06344.1 SRPBCC family protein [Leptospiraceae bacterium]HMX30977.1 SRPBCC family protein [Leptospiraceae bacterium]HMY32204.1 SRPBCC family protein [Leptospiraceae bacterium]HMZ63795.1 SRPBCC family protein [Leptospiraceae bacterium]